MDDNKIYVRKKNAFTFIIYEDDEQRTILVTTNKTI